MKLILRWLLQAGGLILVGYLIPEIEISSFYIAMIAALLIGLINVTIKPLIIILTLPINILTLGLFTLIINALLFWFISSFVVGFIVGDFVFAFYGALVYSILSWLINGLLKK